VTAPSDRRIHAALALAYLATRSFHLTVLPVFMDESIHLFWSTRLLRESWFLRPLDDGKSLQILLQSLWVPGASDPLWAGRFTSVLIGGLGLWATLRIGTLLYDRRVGLVAAGAYLVCPFTFFHDRLALADVYLASFTGLTLLWSLELLRAPTAWGGVRLGLAMAAGVLAKVPGLIGFAFPVAAAGLLGPRSRELRRRLGVAYAVAVMITAFPVIHFFTSTGQIGMKAELEGGAAARLSLAAENAGLALSWLSAYWTLPILLLGAAAALDGLRRRDRPTILLTLAAALPVTVFVLVSFYWFPRYILFATIPFLVLAARGLVGLEAALAARLRDRVPTRGARVALGVGLALLACGPSVAFTARLALDPAAAPLPRVERFQYVDGWPSGYGWDEAARFFRRQLDADRGLITVVVDDRGHRTAFLALRAYLMNQPRLDLVTRDLRDAGVRRQVALWARSRPVYVVRSASRPRRLRPARSWKEFELHPVLSVAKPDGGPIGEIMRLTDRSGGGGSP
jgi:Dolichyl-phosphate-mannose-protein mannosyltransferase